MSETGYTVTYNGLTPWGNLTPFVSLDVEKVFAAGQVGDVRTVTLNGTLTGLGAGMITGLQNAFASNFKEFIAPNISMPNAMVQEVSFDSQNFINKINYSVVLKDFSGFLYNVNKPTDDISYESEKDGSVLVNHKISAEGIATNFDMESALNNAKTFVLNRTGVSKITLVAPVLVSGTNSENMILISQQESINRLNGNYSITEVFRYDPLRNTTSGVFKRFTVEHSSGIDADYILVNINGTYSKQVSWDSGLLQQIAIADFYTIASSVASNINPTPLSFSIDSENASQTENGTIFPKTANVRAVYDNSPSTSYFDYDVEGENDIRGDVRQINIKGTIYGSGKHVRRKFDSALSFYNNTIGGWEGAKNYLYNAAMSGANDFSYNSFPFNTIPQVFAVTFNSGQGIITLNASFNDAPFILGYTDFSWGINTNCGLNIFKSHASANKNGSYVIQDLGIINRTSVDINGSYSYPATGVFLSTEHNNILSRLRELEGHENAFLEEETHNVNSGELVKNGFSYSYTKDGKNIDALPSDGKIFAGVKI